MRGQQKDKEWFEAWTEGPGRVAAANALRKRNISWIEPRDVAFAAAADVWARIQGGAEIGAPERYAATLIPAAITDLQWGGRRASRAKIPVTEWTTDDYSKPAPAPPDEPGRFDPQGPGMDALGSNWEAASEDGERAERLRQIRLRIDDWLATARRTGDRDARFGDPVSQAMVLLYLVMFVDDPLTARFWPSGYPEPDRQMATDDLHRSVAFWLTDRDWFPAEPATDGERRRAQRARTQVESLARTLRLDESEPLS